jgi:tetratricopeptide (TPR) repeat protein
VELQPSQPAWLALRGRVQGARHEWQKAAADFARVVELLPNNVGARLEYGHACAESKQWPQAAAQFQKAIELGNVPAVTWYQQALALVGAGQGAEYRALCARMLARGGAAPSPQLIVQSCRLLPDAVPDFAPVLKLAERLVAADQSYPILRLHGQILYRAGQFEAAVRQLDRSLKARPGRPDLSSATDGFYLAMAHQRLGQADEARRWLKWARDLVGEHEGPNATAQARAPEPWFNRLVLQLIRQEAEAVVMK